MTIFPNHSTFCELAKQGNFLPVYQELVGDLETPVSAWYKVCADRPYNFLLESVEGGETIGRYSFLGCDPLWILETRGDRTTKQHRDGTVETFEGDPFAVLTESLKPYQVVKLPQLPPGLGGLFGFCGYETICWMEPRVPVDPPAATDLPDAVWMQMDRLVVFDRVKQRIWAIAYADVRSSASQDELIAAYEQAAQRVTQLTEQLQTPLVTRETSLPWTPPVAPDSPDPDRRPVLDYRSNTTQEAFCASVLKGKEYIKAGDIFQVVLSQRLSVDYTGNPFALYRSLRSINPSPYMAYFRFGDWQLIGSSPEIMVKAETTPIGDRLATTRPLAGTRRRGRTPAEDLALAEELLQDPKERAEHVMLVDLGRNDLGRVCRMGSVRVKELMTIERYSHVMHIVSEVVGELLGDRTAWDLLKACFPAGTVSGAPKIRAMEIIHELESSRRGPYAGTYGYYDFEGQFNTAITIRTMVVRPQPNGTWEVSVQAGAGIVADSDPEKEYEETLNKAKGLLEAIRCLLPQKA